MLENGPICITYQVESNFFDFSAPTQKAFSRRYNDADFRYFSYMSSLLRSHAPNPQSSWNNWDNYKNPLIA